MRLAEKLNWKGLNQSFLLTDHQNHHHNHHHHHHYYNNLYMMNLITYVQTLSEKYLMNISSNCHITTTKVLLLPLDMV
jgi:hypothetical protein